MGAKRAASRKTSGYWQRRQTNIPANKRRKAQKYLAFVVASRKRKGKDPLPETHPLYKAAE